MKNVLKAEIFYLILKKASGCGVDSVVGIWMHTQGPESYFIYRK
jgi:hypothetical protein